MIRFFRYLRGYLLIKVWGFSAERFMNLCGSRGILLWDIRKEGDAYCMLIGLRSFYRLRPIMKKTKTRAVVLQRYGLPFLLPNLLRRKVFLFGLCMAVSFWLWSSFYIWDIELEGNLRITEDVFSDFLEKEGVRTGMRRSSLDIGSLEKEIRKTFSEITWTSAKLSGTRLQISIKENDAPIAPPTADKEGASNLLSEYDGVIVSMIVRSGVPKAAIGESVAAGAVLVEGSIPIYNDDASVREYRYVHADADIVIERREPFAQELPFAHIEKTYTGRTKKKPFLRIGTKEWKLQADSPYLVYDSVMRQSRPFLFEKLSIPIYFGDYTYREYQNVEYLYSLSEAEKLLNEKLTTFLTTLEEKGLHIIEKDVKIDTNENAWMVFGSLLVQGKAGKSVALNAEAGS